MNEIKNQQTSSMVEIFINLLSFLLLGIVATSIGFLYFQAINKFFPDILSSTYQNYQFSSFNAPIIHYSIASLFVGFPIYVWAMWFWFKSFKSSAGSKKIESKLSKWLTYIILLIASGTIIGDLITIIYNFLQGEYGARFLLKALAILVIAGLIFGFYFFERKKIQYKKEISSVFFPGFLIFSSILIISSVVLGFIVGGTPLEARIRKFDLQRSNDLQGIANCISNFAFDNERLPKDLPELKNNVRYEYCSIRINDPETGKDYEYRAVSKGEFELCGVFNMSNLDEFENTGYYATWQKHDKGRMCGKQTVTFGKQPLPIGK